LGKTTTFTFLALVIVFALAGAGHGKAENLRPLFSHSPLLSVFLAWQVVPWLLSGFESVGKYCEEASPDFKSSGYFVAIALTIGVGLAFFWVVISAVAYVAPWQALKTNQQFPTAIAFERALHAHWIVVLILASALVSLVQCFNANLIASSRVLFAMARRNLLLPKLQYVNPDTHTPTLAVALVGAAIALTMFLGEAGLVPILEVGALSSAIGWMSACVAFLCMKPNWVGRMAAAFGVLVTGLMVFAKILPYVPGHFSVYEWIALAIWAVLGIAISAPFQFQRKDVPSKETAPSHV
jgi:amino acid transporter